MAACLDVPWASGGMVGAASGERVLDGEGVGVVLAAAVSPSSGSGSGLFEQPTRPAVSAKPQSIVAIRLRGPLECCFLISTFPRQVAGRTSACDRNVPERTARDQP